MIAEGRILRTAQEAHCARFGRYAATFQELKDKKLLSTLPGYHDMSFNDAEGPCGSTSYALYPTPDTSSPPSASLLARPGVSGAWPTTCRARS